MGRHILVCGAGSAGCVVAARLTEDPDTSVLLIEGGPDYATPEVMPEDIRSAWVFGGTAHDWGYVSEAVEYDTGGGSSYATTDGRGLPVFRGKVVGGSSSVNATNACRPGPRDFARWVGLGNDRWSWDEVRPFVLKVENDPAPGDWHSRSGPVSIRRYTDDGGQLGPLHRTFLEASTRLGHAYLDDVNRPGVAGVGPLSFNQIGDVRQSANLAYLPAARQRANFELRAQTEVDRLIIKDGRARGIVLVDGERIDADLVVLSAGAIGSPAILQRSGIGPTEWLDQAGISLVQTLPGVGRNLRDHSMIYPTHQIDAATIGALTPPLQVILMCSADGVAADASEIDLHVMPLTLEAGAIVTSIGLVTPRSFGHVAVRSPDPFEAPVIDLGLLAHPDDVRRMVQGLKIMRDVYATPEMERFALQEVWPGAEAATDGQLARAIQAAPNSYAHAVGTCSMGAAGTDWAVVNQFGQVHGTAGAYVIDASIFPQIPAVPTNLVTMAVAERCVYELRRSHV